jgi:predicted methyltransferase
MTISRALSLLAIQSKQSVLDLSGGLGFRGLPLAEKVGADGTVAVLDWLPDAVSKAGAPRHHRLSVKQVTKCLSEAGFTSVMQTWQDDDAYLIKAR